MSYLLDPVIKIPVEEAVKVAVDHPFMCSTIGAAMRRLAVLFWL